VYARGKVGLAANVPRLFLFLPTMPSDTPTTYTPSQQEILLRIAETGDALLRKLDDIHQTLLKQNHTRQARRHSTVEDFVAALLVKFPYRNWTPNRSPEKSATAVMVVLSEKRNNGRHIRDIEKERKKQTANEQTLSEMTKTKLMTSSTIKRDNREQFFHGHKIFNDCYQRKTFGLM
jgi:inosine-uridine nucleoside N-ribohydrolase